MELFGVQLPVLLLLGCIGFAAAFLQGLSGFGFPLVAVPLFSFFLPLQTVVPATTLLSFSSTLMLLPEAKNIRPRLKEAVTLVAASLVFIPLGVWCLKHMETGWLKVFIGVLALVCTWLLLRGMHFTVRRPYAWGVLVGAVCGFLSGLANLAGPVLVGYLNNLKLEKKVFRAFTVLMFTAMSIGSSATAALNGLVTGQVLLVTAVLLPVIMLGSLVGARVSKRVDEKIFRNLTLIVLACSSLSILVQGLSSLL